MLTIASFSLGDALLTTSGRRARSRPRIRVRLWPRLHTSQLTILLAHRVPRRRASIILARSWGFMSVPTASPTAFFTAMAPSPQSTIPVQSATPMLTGSTMRARSSALMASILLPSSRARLAAAWASSTATVASPTLTFPQAAVPNSVGPARMRQALTI